MAGTSGFAALALIATLGIPTPRPSSTPTTISAPADEIPYESLAHDFLNGRGLDVTDPDATTIETVFSQGFIRLELGAFELLYPPEALADPGSAECFQRACRAVLASHGTWLDWVDPEGEVVPRKEADADLKILDKWIKSWKEQDLAAAAGARNLATSLPAKDKELAALTRFNERLLAGGFPTKGTEELRRVRLVLVPDRATFVPFSAAVGWLVPDQRSVYWVPGIVNWVEFRFDDTRVVSLEFAAGDATDWTKGTAMDARNDLGLEQQIVQLAFGSLALARFDNRIDPDFTLALCNNLVIDQYGQVDTRTDGDLSPRQAAARKIFVPGGLSQGGRLPQNNANSPWRSTLGTDHFLKVLRDSQKRGAKEADAGKATDRFLIQTADEAGRFVARAPFFGAAAAETEVPGDAYQSEWLELQRAYRVAFCHWLRDHGAGSKSASHRAFGELLSMLAPEGEVDFAALVEQAFDAPVSSKEPGKGDLEGRFLLWLSKQKK